jgi:hypothetical protein
MSSTIAVLVWLLLITSEIVTVLATIGSLGVGMEDQEVKFILLGILGIFLAVTIGWGIWAIYPYTLL